MSGAAKLFVILQFLIVGGFLFFSLKALNKINEQGDMIGNLRQSVTEQIASSSELEGTLTTARANIEELRGRRNTLIADINSTRDALAAMTDSRDREVAARKKADQEKAIAEAGKAKAEAELKTCLAQNKKLTDDLSDSQKKCAKLESDNSRLDVRVAELTAQNYRLQTQLTKGPGKSELREQLKGGNRKAAPVIKLAGNESEKIKQMQAILNELTIANNRLEKQVFAANKANVEMQNRLASVGMTDNMPRPKSKRGAVPRPVRGKVVVMSSKYGVAGISFSGAAIPEEGDVYLAYRDGEKVGELKVEDIARTILIFDSNDKSKTSNIKKNDSVIFLR